MHRANNAVGQLIIMSCPCLQYNTIILLYSLFIINLFSQNQIKKNLNFAWNQQIYPLRIFSVAKEIQISDLLCKLETAMLSRSENFPNLSYKVRILYPTAVLLV